MKRTLIAIAGIAAIAGFAACSPDSTDFKSEGEDFLEDTDGDVASGTGFTFSDADCEKPSSTDEGTTYDCTATDDEGDVWDFSIEITGERELTVISGYHPKLLKQVVVDELQSLGTVDEACVEEVLAGFDEQELKDAFIDGSVNAAPSDESAALLQEIGSQASASCVA